LLVFADGGEYHVSIAGAVCRADSTLPESATVSLPLPPACDNARSFLLPTNSGKAVLGLVLGLLSFFLGVLASVPAFICAARALAEIKRDPAHVKGRGLALTGIFAAGLGLFMQPVLLLYLVEVMRDRVRRETDAANLQRIGEAMFAYNDRHGHLPPAAREDANGQPLLSWRVELLPYLGEKELYSKFHLDEPWDSPHNFELIDLMPKAYSHPADPEAAAQGLTYYRVFVGGTTPFSARHGPVLPASFVNGTSNTFLVVTAADAVPWTKPEELLYDFRQPPPKLGGQVRGGYNVLLANGKVHFMPEDSPEELLRMASGGEGKGGMRW
jgi:hypothetical protein